jgi:arylsulfatase A
MKLQLFALFLAAAVSAALAERPNIVILLADDAGYSDFGCFGGKAETPNIDQLAAEGLKLTDFHAAAPNCSPSRTGLLTGRYPSRVGVYSYIPEQKEGLHPMHMPSSEVTLAELLKESGYQTAHVGKWHVSVLRSTQPQPSDQGFDYSFGTMPSPPT